MKEYNKYLNINRLVLTRTDLEDLEYILLNIDQEVAPLFA